MFANGNPNTAFIPVICGWSLGAIQILIAMLDMAMVQRVPVLFGPLFFLKNPEDAIEVAPDSQGFFLFLRMSVPRT
ncbi:MAG: hypothetical protein HOI47_15900 [Candidatus Scalindua sp.]|jgi:hypothetical protein|nr:hypothetical protein [Candidatus Scalindua sp.]MBT6048010.1 hypothetical protein [Candidatus Scalindua sp.]MBT6228128.1 hypothetical protein [Candidatus Scalindua sp.]